jgi:hypothetical protein
MTRCKSGDYAHFCLSIMLKNLVAMAKKSMKSMANMVWKYFHETWSMAIQPYKYLSLIIKLCTCMIAPKNVKM